MNTVKIQIFILALGGCICFLTTMFSFIIKYKRRARKNALLIIEFSTFLLLIADMLEYIYRGNTSGLGFWMVRICNFLMFFLIYTELLGMNLFIRTFLPREHSGLHLENRIVSIIAYIGMGMLVISQFTGMYYRFDELNQYVRGPLFGVSFVMPLLIYLYFLSIIVRFHKEFSKWILMAIVTFAVLPLACMVIQILFYGISLFDMSIGVAAIVMFSLSLIDQNAYLRQIASHERMTGLPNTYGYLQELEKKIAEKKITEYTAFYFDIIRMGMINRKYGNLVGDKIIVDFTKILRARMDDSEVLGRLGGNYFVALLRRENADKFLHMLEGVEVPVQNPGGTEIVMVRSVAGVYDITDEKISAEGIMTNVSLAVNVAKNVKKKPYVYLTKELLAEMNEQRQLQEMIPRCMAQREFIPYYQPKVDAEKGTLCGAEALARWMHDGKIVPPGRFIPIMEQNESICQFDFYMLEYVCRDIRGWLDRGIDPPQISINFSRKNLGNPILSEAIYNVTKKYNIPQDLVQIEITETVDEYPIDYLKGVVEALQRYGMTAAIDDFGTGSSTIRILKDVPFDVLKVDKSFIDSTTPKNRNLLAHIIAMAKEMGAKVITEGVETEDQLEVLLSLGCTEIQGYLFDRPLPKEEFEKRILDRHYPRKDEVK